MSNYTTSVIRLPDNPVSSRAIMEGMRQLVERHGGEITGASKEDEMSVLDMIEQHEDFDGYIADEARVRVKELHAAHSHENT